MVQYYELIYIIPVKFSGNEFEKIQNKVKEIIQKEGGEIAYEENLGKKKLSYTIKHNTQGFYIIHEFEIESDKIKSINEKIKLTPEVIRHLIFKKKKLTKEERQKEKERKAKKESMEEEKETMAQQFNIEKQLEDSESKPEINEEVEKQPEVSSDEKKEESAFAEATGETQGEKEEITEEKKTPISPKREEKKIKLEDLDEKLDTIINDNFI